MVNGWFLKFVVYFLTHNNQSNRDTDDEEKYNSAQDLHLYVRVPKQDKS